MPIFRENYQHWQTYSDIFYGIWILFLSSITAFSFIKCKRKLDREYRKLELHHRKHNCVVMFAGSRITGWPGFDGEYKISVRDIEKAFEPICYFISTANKSLDIAVMIICSNIIMDAIISAVKRGVRIRLLLDYNIRYQTVINTALQYGAEVRQIKKKTDKCDSIFHYKYAVKDYSECEGYVVCGSANWTVTSFVQNYENMVFMSNYSAVSAFHNNFENEWDFIKKRGN